MKEDISVGRVYHFLFGFIEYQSAWQCIEGKTKCNINALVLHNKFSPTQDNVAK